MKFTQLLFKQHIGKAQRYLWQHQRDRSIPITKAGDILKSMNFPIQDATEVIAEVQRSVFPRHTNVIINATELNEVKPDYNTESCLIFNEKHLLQEGIEQACLLTKTIKLEDELPKKIKDLITEIPENINDLLQRYVSTSVIYDAQQVKLPRLKDPERPAWVFPRVYGITSTRKMHNLTRKFLQLCESLSGLEVAQDRLIVHSGLMSTYIGKESEKIKFSTKMDIMMTSAKPLTQIIDANVADEFTMPNIYPLHYTIGLPKSNIHETADIYPVTMESSAMNTHTIFVNHNPEEVKNITELPITQDQIHAHSMIKSFIVASTCARQRFGLDVQKLPEPIVVQCVQSDGQTFHYSVYQLNTLDIDGEEGTKNFWWSEPSIKLYEEAGYDKGQPCLKGYNSNVFARFFAFYKNK